MTQSIVTKLILKDLHFNRALIVGGVLAGLAGIYLMSVNRLAGIIVFVTVVVVCAIFLGQATVTRERVEKSALFVLSLPVSPAQYTAAKVAGATISFLTVWGILLGTCVLLISLGPAPADGLPWLVGIMTLILTNFFILLTVGVFTFSEKWIASSIILTNTSVPVFFARSGEATPGWTTGLMASFALEALIVAFCIGLLLYTQSRRKDFV